MTLTIRSKHTVKHLLYKQVSNVWKTMFGWLTILFFVLQTTKEINQDHLYSATKSKKTKRKLSVATEQSENNKKTNKTAVESDSYTSTMDTNKTFKCDKCGAQSVTNPLLRGNRLKTGKHTASPRRKVDPETNRILCLCNACGEKMTIKLTTLLKHSLTILVNTTPAGLILGRGGSFLTRIISYIS